MQYLNRFKIISEKFVYPLIVLLFLSPLAASALEPKMQTLLETLDPPLRCVAIDDRKANAILVQTRRGERLKKPRKMRKQIRSRIVKLCMLRRSGEGLSKRQRKRLKLLRARRKFATQCIKAKTPETPPSEPEEELPPPQPEPTPEPETDPQIYTNLIEQHGITWIFDGQYSYGKFANGDYWVLGPVTITQITPDFTGTAHGFEIDPKVGTSHGFDPRIAGYDSSLVPELPIVVDPVAEEVNAVSIVKSISRDPAEATGDTCGASGSDRNCLKTASVLTVLSELPEDQGQSTFRPPYVASTENKLIKSSDALRLDLLPALPSTPAARNPEWVIERFKRVHLGHHQSVVHTQRMRPKDYLPSYGANFAIMNSEAALTLMLDFPEDQKREAVINYVQAGIDLYGMLLEGKTWEPNGGHGLIGKLAQTIAAVLLDDQEMKDTISSVPYATFHEDGKLYFSQHANNGDGAVLYGQIGGGINEYNYWQRVVLGTASATLRDPYGYVDGGGSPGTSYQHCCNSLPWKYTALAMHLLPGTKDVWNNEQFFEYADRWVEYGAWALPDPCAPSDGNMDNYGETFGPDGAGGCILDPKLEYYNSPSDFGCQEGLSCGRFPERHFQNADGGARAGGVRSSTFGDEMWEQYR